MEARQIRYFLTACDSLNFTRAAEACGVAVPTLTRAIKALEEEVGGALFRRERHIISLSDLGRLMQQHLAEAQQNIDAAQQAAQRYRRLADRLKLGVMTTMPATPLIRYLDNLRAAAPDLEMWIWESHCAELDQALKTGEIDLAIMSLPGYDDSLRTRELMREPYRVAFPPGHRFEAMEAVPMRELDGEPYVKRLHCEFPANFAKLGTAPPYESVSVRYVSEREDWVQAMVQAGFGVAMMPAYLPILPELPTRPLVEPEVSRTICLVSVGGRPHSAPVRLAIEAAGNTVWEPR